MQRKVNVWGIVELTPVIILIVVFLLYTSQDTHWGGGFWESWLQLHWKLSSFEAKELVFWVRKIAHFLGYGSFSLLLWVYFYWWRLPSPYLFGLLSTVSVAAFDEYTQSETNFRSGKPQDVMIDLCGALLFYSVVALWLRYGKTNETEYMFRRPRVRLQSSRHKRKRHQF